MIFKFPEIELHKLEMTDDDNDYKTNFINTIKQTSHNFTEGNRTAYETYKRLFETITFEADELNPTAFLFHRNFLNYLEKCWAIHYGIVINPDIIWYTILSEFAAIVKSSPKDYEHLFTSSTTKKTLIVQAGGLLTVLLMYLKMKYQQTHHYTSLTLNLQKIVNMLSMQLSVTFAALIMITQCYFADFHL